MPRYRFDPFVFDSSDGRLARETDGQGQGAAVTLRPQVGRLLAALLAEPRAVIDRESLCRAVWGEKAVVDFEAGLAAIVHELRQVMGRLGAQADLLETIPRRGYRLNADAELIAGTGAEAGPAPETKPGTGRRLAWAAAGALLLLLSVAAWWARPTAVAPPATELTLAVLPFEHFGGEPGEGPRIGLLLADRLLAALWQAELDGIALVGRVSLLPYQGREDVAELVAAKLGVQLLIEGSITGGEDEWQVSARLLRMPGGRVLWSETLDWREAPDIPVRQSVSRLVERLEQAWEQGLRGQALESPGP